MPASPEVARLVRFAARPNWYVRHEGARVSTGTSDRAAAEKFLAEFIAEQARPDPGAAVRIPAVLTLYLADRRARKLPGAERLSWAHKPLARHLAAVLAAEFAEADALRYIAAREAEGVAPGTYRTELSSLRAALRWAAGPGKLISVAPAVPVPSRPPARERWLTREEAAKLVESCCRPHVRLFVLLGLHTGARAGAILGLTWERVDLERRRIDYREPGKAQTRKRRVPVPINDTLAAALEAERARLTPSPADAVVVFAGAHVASVKHAFGDAARRAGLADVTPHTLRHTAATWAAQAGVPLFQIAGLLGHSDMRMISEVYGHHHPDHLRDVARALG